MGDLTKNFSISEFAQLDPYRPVPAEYRANVTRLANQLQVIRDAVGRITITSSYRTLAHNTAIGGARTSQHLTAKAADFVAPGSSKRHVYCTILELIARGDIEEGGLGWYGARGHIHYDVRGFKRRWNKTTGALPVCPPVVPEEEDYAMKVYRLDKTTQLWGYNGAQLWRMNGEEFELEKELGLKTPVPVISKARLGRIRKRLHMD